MSTSLKSQLHAITRLRSQYLQSSSVQGENDRFAIKRAAVNKVVNAIHIVNVAMISGRIEFGSLKSGIPLGAGGTIPLGGVSAIVICLLLWQRDSAWGELPACEMGVAFACYKNIERIKQQAGRFPILDGSSQAAW